MSESCSLENGTPLCQGDYNTSPMKCYWGKALSARHLVHYLNRKSDNLDDA